MKFKGCQTEERTINEVTLTFELPGNMVLDTNQSAAMAKIAIAAYEYLGPSSINFAVDAFNALALVEMDGSKPSADILDSIDEYLSNVRMEIAPENDGDPVKPDIQSARFNAVQATALIILLAAKQLNK
jgi:hypothetical protein